ncbi:MAG: hypothetical protein ACLS4Z_09665 [Christensenellaceae bacterium]
MSEKELRKAGFEPVFDKESRLLVLGSFPSVKSRKIQFYYGNKQNRFWKTVCNFFGEEIPESTEGKGISVQKKIALWDMVTECEIEGSADSAVKTPPSPTSASFSRRRRSKRYFSTERCPITLYGTLCRPGRSLFQNAFDKSCKSPLRRGNLEGAAS